MLLFWVVRAVDENGESVHSSYDVANSVEDAMQAFGLEDTSNLQVLLGTQWFFVDHAVLKLV